MQDTNGKDNMSRVNRSKYNFAKLEMGASFPISPMDLYSMKNSLRFFNNKHKKNVVVDAEEQADGSVLVTRVPVKIKKQLNS